MNFNWKIMRTTLLAVSVLAFATLSDFNPARAQLALSKLRSGSNTVFAIAPREATRPLKIAEKSIKDGDFQQATALLGELLADPMLNEYLIPIPDSKGRAISLRQKAEQLLSEIPLDQRGTYQEKYGVKAKVMLQKAIEANDTQAIATISRLYFHTHAGLEATMLVGHTHLSEGRPVLAAVAFEKVAREPQGSSRFDPEATLLAAVSWSLNGSNDRSGELLLALKEKQGDAKVRFYGKTVTLFDPSTPRQSTPSSKIENDLDAAESSKDVGQPIAEDRTLPRVTGHELVDEWAAERPLTDREELEKWIAESTPAEKEKIEKWLAETPHLQIYNIEDLLDEDLATIRWVLWQWQMDQRKRVNSKAKSRASEQAGSGSATTNTDQSVNYGSISLFAENTPLRKWLKEIVASTPLDSHAIVNQWLLFRGDSQRNAESGSGFPLLSPRWSIRTVVDPADEAGIQEFQQKLIKNKISPMPKVHPLAIGRTLVIRTENRMFGIDADSGKRMWSYPPANVFRSGEQKSEDSLGRTSKKLHQDKLRERLWLDALYGQISSDGDSIFLIPNPGISTDHDDWRSYHTQVYDEPTDLRLYNELKSLDLKQQGALQWQVGGESGLDEPELAKSFFLGAPLPIDDRLYAICVQEKIVKLVVLNSETGRLQWSRHLASTEESVTFREERLRRLAGATPSEANGVLICPTGLNAIVAVDLATQSLTWGFQFKQPKAAKRIDRPTDQLTKWNTMWRDATVTLTGGTVVYTPIDSTAVYCLNLQTGESLWKDDRKGRSRERFRFMHVETVRDGNVIITSSDRLKAIDLKTGTVAWETLFKDYGLVSGRGYVSGSHCFVPTTSKKVLRINTGTGEIDGFVMTEKVLGNLISFRGDVISHGADHLTAYPRDEPSRLMLAEGTETQLAEHSQLSIKAQLHLLDGEYEQSVDAISQAYDLFPNSNYAKVLVQALTRLINVNFTKAEQVSNRYQNLFEKQDLHRLLQGKVSGLIKLKRFEEAFETLLQIAETIDLESLSAKPAGQKIDDENSVVLLAASVDKAKSLANYPANAELKMQLSQWLRWKLNEVYQACDAQTQETYRTAVNKHLKLFQRDSLTLRHDRIRLFPADSLGENIRMKTAAELLAAGHYVRANSLMEEANANTIGVQSDNRSPAEPTYSILSRAESLRQTMVDADFTGDAISALEETIVKLRAIQSSGRAILDPDLYKIPAVGTKVGKILRADEINVDWSRDVTRLEQKKLSNYFLSTQHFCEIVATDQPELNTLSFQYSDEFREFQMYDRLGRFVHKIYLDPDGNFQGTKQGAKGSIFLHRSLLLLCIDKGLEKEMFAIDWEKFVRGEAALLWSAENVSCSSSGYNSGSMDGISVIHGDGLVMCLNPFTGNVLWQRNQISPRARIIEGDQSLTIWNRALRTYDKVDPIMGRVLSCGRMDRYSGSASVVAKDLQLFVFRKSVAEESENEDEKEKSNDESDSIFESPRKTVQTIALNLFDYDQQKVLWTKTLPHPAHSALVDQNKLLVLSKDSVFSMFDLRSGELKFETKMPGLNMNSVSSIVVDRFNGLYVVTVYSVNPQPDFVTQDDIRVSFQQIHKGNSMIHGRIVALDAKTGDSVWKYPITVQSFQQLEGLPWDSPFLFLTRRNRYDSNKTSVRIQMAMVDLQSGKLKANELFTVPVRDNVFYRVICQPQSTDDPQQSIELQVAALKAKFYLGDVATPPQPVAALTNLGSFKRMEQVVSASPTAPLLATDFQKLTDQAIAAEKQRVELSKEEVRLTDLEMKKK